MDDKTLNENNQPLTIADELKGKIIANFVIPADIFEKNKEHPKFREFLEVISRNLLSFTEGFDAKTIHIEFLNFSSKLELNKKVDIKILPVMEKPKEISKDKE